MEPTAAYQLTIYTFGAATAMLWLVAIILLMSMLRIMRINRIEAEMMMVAVPVTTPQFTPAPRQEKTQPASRRKELLEKAVKADVDIKISPDDLTVTEKRYQPRPIVASSEISAK